MILEDSLYIFKRPFSKDLLPSAPGGSPGFYEVENKKDSITEQGINSQSLRAKYIKNAWSFPYGLISLKSEDYFVPVVYDYRFLLYDCLTISSALYP